MLPALLLLCLLAQGNGPLAQEAQLLNDGSGGELELAGEKQLVLTGMRGTFALRLGKPGSLIYGAREQKNRREELPVALWLEGSTLRFGPLDEASAEPVFMEIAVPPGLDVEIDLAESHVSLVGLLSDVRVGGSDLDLRASGLSESLRVRLEGGSVRLEGLSAGIELEGRGLEVLIRQAEGQVELNLTESEIELDIVGGVLIAELVDSVLVAERLQDFVQVVADGGSVALTRALRGAELQLGNTPVTLVEVEQGLDIETEADVEFRDLKSDLRMVSYGGGLRGQGNNGGVHANMDGATVILQGIGGPVTIEGRELRISLRDLKSEVRVATTMSSVSVQNAGASVEIDNDFGDIVVNNAAGPLKVNSRDGGVRIAELMGALELSADGPEVQVSWAKIPADTNSTLKNERGDISVTLPERGRCRVEAIARFGRVNSDLPGVQVSDDGKYGNGLLGGADQPVISIDSGGAVYIGPSEGEAGQ